MIPVIYVDILYTWKSLDVNFELLQDFCFLLVIKLRTKDVHTAMPHTHSLSVSFSPCVTFQFFL